MSCSLLFFSVFYVTDLTFVCVELPALIHTSPPLALPSACRRLREHLSSPQADIQYRGKQSEVRYTRADSYLSRLPLNLIHSPSLLLSPSHPVSSFLLSLSTALFVSLAAPLPLSVLHPLSPSLCLYPDLLLVLPSQHKSHLCLYISRLEAVAVGYTALSLPFYIS